MNPLNVILVFIIGWFSGGLTNHLAAIIWGEEKFCPNCGASYQWSHWLPWPRGCQQCQDPGSPLAWGIHISTCLALILLWFGSPDTNNFAFTWMILTYFGIISVIDIKHRRMPLIVLSLGGLLTLAVGGFSIGFAASLAGGLAALLLLFGVHLFGKMLNRRFPRWRGCQNTSLANNPEGNTPDPPALFGFGDVLFGASLGLLVGWFEIWNCLFVALLSAAIFGSTVQLVMLIRHRYRAEIALPLAPFLVSGALWVLVR